MPTTTSKIARPTNAAIRPALFKTYPAAYTLVPLHAWDAKSKDRGGKVRSDGKRPRDKDWTNRAYDRATVLRACVSDNLNVGVRLKPDQLVIDVDPRNGGTEGFAKLCKDLKLRPSQWPRVNTGSGGFHYYMSKPEDVPVLDTLEGYPGVEFKSKGRQVVAAGSVHPNGNPYVWDISHPDISLAPEAPAVLLEAIRRPERSAVSGSGQYTQEQIARALDKLDVTKFRDHAAWLQIMMATHHASAGDARSEFVEWSCGDPEYNQDAEIIGRRWDSLHKEKNDGVTYRTLNKLLADAGHADLQPMPDASEDFEAEPEDFDFDSNDEVGTDLVPVESRGLKVDKRSRKAADTIENALAAVTGSPLNPCWNDLKQCVEFRGVLPWGEEFGRVLSDHTLRLARVYFINQHQGNAYLPGKDHLLEALMTVAYARKFNPVLEYLDGLTWDGVPRVEKLFGKYFNCGDDAYTRGVSRAFMVGAVRRQRQPGCKFDTLPIARGPQGAGKSTAVRVLFGDDFYSDADLGSLQDKDSALKLRGIWVQELAELESLSRSQAATLKAFCSRAIDRQRSPYERIVEDAPRRCVFIGTGNESGYLKDATGARRFWPLEVRGEIDLAALAADRDQLWAEAAALEAQGASVVLDRKLWATAAERQADQTSDDPWTDIIAAHLEERMVPEEGCPLPPANRTHTSELFAALSINPSDQTRDKAQRLRTVMEACLGWRHKRNLRIGGRIAAGYVRIVDEV